MCTKYLGFVLLIWFPGMLHAQSAAQPCNAPRLDGGFFAPNQETYPHGTALTYLCDKGRKPAVGGYSATSTCQNGNWTHEPQCIEETACTPPTIHNATYTESQTGWYENGSKIRIKCNNGYEHEDYNATARCENGEWSTLPNCEKSTRTCGAPPEIPHAIVVGQGYKELFPADSFVQYECEDGYTTKDETFIICLSGNWTEGPVCRNGTIMETNQGGPRNPDLQTKLAAGVNLLIVLGKETGQGTQLGGSAVGGGGWGQPASAGSGTRDGTGSSGRSHEIETKPRYTTTETCGRHPVVSNGVLMRDSGESLWYRCNVFYKLVGPGTVRCYSDGTWSQVPTCKATYCSVNTYAHPELKPAGNKFLKDGEKVVLDCVEERQYDQYAVVRCTDGRLQISECCNWVKITLGVC